MASTAQPLMVIGHKNPDTDSICSAIAYACYKQQVMGVPAKPYRAGNLNPQTTFVLEHFGVPSPELLVSLLPKVSDIMIRGEDLMVLSEEDPVGLAQKVIIDRRFAFLPVVDRMGKYAGKISALRLAGMTQDIAELHLKKSLRIHWESFIESIGGMVEVGQVPSNAEGPVWLPGLTEAPLPQERPVLVVVAAGNELAFEQALGCGAAVVVQCGAAGPGGRDAHARRERVKCLVSTLKSPLAVATQICLASPLRDFIEREHPTFRPNDLVREVGRTIRQYNEGGFIVVDDQGGVCGVLTRLSFLTSWRFRVALVDHNELSQAVEGIEEANVEEVIDHHRLGYRSTDQPITFINKVVGCTSTIIAELFRNAGQIPPTPVAGLMLAAILSDTVILQSPTTTPLDRDMVEWLAAVAGVNFQDFGAKMFAAGCALEGMDPARIIRQDAKVYQEEGCRFAVSQIETVGFDSFTAMRKALEAELAQATCEAQCQFSCLMVTDITSSTSLLLCAGDPKYVEAISYPPLGDNLFEMHGVLSRKKQMVPYLIDLVRRLHSGN